MIDTVLTFLGLGSKRSLFKLVAIGAVVLLVVGTIYAGYRYVSDLTEENEQLVANITTLEANNTQLKQSIQDQQNAIDSLQTDIQQINQVQQETFERFDRARNRVQDLEEKLSRHEIGFLASQRPSLVENIVNNATDDVGRCFEIASGSPLTQQEIDATLKSEINSECPELANPSYTGN